MRKGTVALMLPLEPAPRDLAPERKEDSMPTVVNAAFTTYTRQQRSLTLTETSVLSSKGTCSCNPCVDRDGRSSSKHGAWYHPKALTRKVKTHSDAGAFDPKLNSDQDPLRRVAVLYCRSDIGLQ